MPKTLSEIAAAVGGVEGDAGVVIEGAAGLDDADAGDIVFVEHARHSAQAAACAAAAVIAPPGVPVPGKTTVRVGEPRLAFAQVLALFRSPERVPAGVAATASVAAGASVAEGAAIGDFCRVCQGAVIGAGAVLYPFVYVGENASVGPETVLYPHVTVYHDVHIGARVRVHAGSVLGADGFGYVQMNGGHQKIPHIGTVVIEDDVEIGACVCVDRAKTAETRIGRGTKIDNLVQVAHNVRVGPDSLVVAQAGIAGSACLGDHVVVAGQAGINSHVEIGAGARIAGQAGVFSNVPAGATVSGYPARDHRDQMRVLAAAQRLPEMVRTVRDLRKRVEELERLLVASAG